MTYPPELKMLIRKRDVVSIAKYCFPNCKPAQNLTPTQAMIVRKIAYAEVKRLSISAYTRYGKTQTVAIGIALFMIFHPGKRIKFIGPKDEQAGIIRDYMSDLVLDCPFLKMLTTYDVKGHDTMKKETSKKRMRFKDGGEYRVLTAYGDAAGAMGHGGDLLVVDESGLIKRAPYLKIIRMLGDDAENAMLIEMYNPWDRDSIAYEHAESGRYEVIHIDWRIGVKEGRTTKEHIMEMAEECGGMDTLEFQVLYESKFPDEAEDSLFNLATIKRAKDRDYGFEEKLIELLSDRKKLDNRMHNMHEGEYISKRNQINAEIKKYTKIVACDPAEMGKDETVFYWGIKYGNLYEITGIYTEAKSDPMELVGKLWDKAKEYIGRDIQGDLNIDRIGIGSGPFSRLKELKREQDYRNIKINGCHFGEAAINKDTYQNKKAENYFRLDSLFREDMIAISKIPIKSQPKINKQLMAIKKKRSSSSKWIIVDPEDYSPDRADAMVYFTWKDNSDLSWVFG